MPIEVARAVGFEGGVPMVCLILVARKSSFYTKQIESGSNDDGRAPASATAAQRVAFGRALLRADTPAKSSAAAATMSAGGSVSAGRRPAPPL